MIGVVAAAPVAIRYTAYGYSSGHRQVLPCGFSGVAQDAVTRLYPLGLGHRFYHSRLQRFLQPDSLSPFDTGGHNAYAYCAGDPINRSDRSGRRWESLGWGTEPKSGTSALRPAPKAVVARAQFTVGVLGAQVAVDKKGLWRMFEGTRIVKIDDRWQLQMPVGSALPHAPSAVALLSSQGVRVKVEHRDSLNIAVRSAVKWLSGGAPDVQVPLQSYALTIGRKATEVQLSYSDLFSAAIKARRV